MDILSRTGLDLAAISPKNGPMFSPNLYAFLNKTRNHLHLQYGRIWRDAGGTLWLGYQFEGEFFGARLMNVLCEGATTQTFCYANLGVLTEVEGFWNHYRAVGRCAIDPSHVKEFIGSDTRWTVVGDVRSCSWCKNATQRLRLHTETVVRETWETA